MSKVGQKMPRGTPEQRFWAKVDKSGDCWLWTANKNSRGYGLFAAHSGKTVSAHRFSFALAFGPVPEGMHVCHRCDTPTCVNPAHLFAGTNRDNMLDGVAKGRVDFAAIGRRGRAKQIANSLPRPPRLPRLPRKRPAAAPKPSARPDHFASPEHARRVAAAVPDGRANWNGATECDRGHYLSPANVLLRVRGQRTVRECRECTRQRRQRHRTKRSA